MFKSRNKKIALALVTVTLLAGFLFIGAQPRCAAEGNDYESIEQMKGSLSQKASPDPAAFERANYMETLVTYATPNL